MFVSVREQGRRRPSQTYGVSKAARSSKLSLLSAITIESHGSNDSASTITQESYKRSTAAASSKRRRSSKQKRPRETREPSISSGKGCQQEAIKEKNMSKESVDVFAFLVKDDEQPTSTPGVGESIYSGRDPSVLEESDNESIVRSQHSDSGVSMGDSSVYHPQQDPAPGHRLPPLPEDAQELGEPQVQPRDRPSHSRRSRWKWPDVPPATHKYHMPNPNMRTPSPEQIRMRPLQTPDDFDKEFCLPARDFSGYELVANKLARGEIPPVLRRFRTVNFRVLLQLQDEISEMEEELAVLDAADDRSRHNPDGSTSPASRRISWQWSQSDLQVHRLQVLGRLYIKLEQYYQALTSAQRVQTLSTSPTPADIEEFRVWLRENNPLSTPESKFLDMTDDLISLQDVTTTPPPPSGGSKSLLGIVPIYILTTTLLPLLCFKIITGVLNRLIVLAVLLAAGISSLEKLDAACSKVEQHQQWLFVCFGVSFLAAVFL